MVVADDALAQATPIERVRYLMARLRDPQSGCPWDLQQSFKTIVPFTIEEAYEVADAIMEEDYPHLQEELGDLVFQVVFYAQMAEEAGHFTFNDILATLEQKLVRRHPHVFPEGTLESRVADSRAVSEESIKANWDAIKAEEKRRNQKQKASSILDDIPAGMAAVKKAQKLQKQAAKKGFDWNDPNKVVAKLAEEIDELQVEVEQGTPARIADELGDLMFCCVNLARHYKLDAEQVLMQANQKFERRFRYLEDQLRSQGVALDDASLEQMEAGWQAAKKTETVIADD